MILLQSNDRFADLAKLDTSTGRVSWFSRQVDSTIASRPIRGHIAQLGGHTLCFYRKEKVLHFRVDDEDLELTEETQVELVHVRDAVNCITVLRHEVPLFAWTYQRPVIDPLLEYDPTPFIDEEQFDFCLFVYNVANDPDRRERIYTEYTHAD
ncbi:MAG: hypothetical protein K8R89_04565 [Anaerolineae bacterium]|nr:hypothetical protein [Anaerolineae bacterium]